MDAGLGCLSQSRGTQEYPHETQRKDHHSRTGRVHVLSPPFVAAVPVLPSINLELAQGMIMSEEKDNSKPQSKPRNGLLVGIVIGAGLGMVFGRMLFGESGTGYVYGSIIAAAPGVVFSLLTAGRQSVTP